jgi:hypothetical protein
MDARRMSVIYVYGFVPVDTALPPGGLLGVGDVEAELFRYDGFYAVVGQLPETEYAGDVLEDRGRDVEWMAAHALRHEQVVAWFVDHATILPSRLLTLFSSRPALDESVTTDAGRIIAALRRFGDVREWDLKVGYDAAVLEPNLGEVSEAIGRLDREIAGSAPGRAFLLRKKRSDLARAESRATAARLATALLDRLSSHAEDVARIPPPADQAPLVLSAALLMPRGREMEALELARDEAAHLAPLGIDVRYTGPWAPYRFLGHPDD